MKNSPRGYGNTMQGKFKPKHPEKYKGDPTEIIFRSSYEFKLFRTLDADPKVLQWGSEEMALWYISPADGQAHRYFPDIVVKFINEHGKVVTQMIEVKPAAQCEPPKPGLKGTNDKRYLQEVITFGINQAKWAAAREYCAKRGWEFKVFTEKELKIPINKKKKG